MSPKAIFVYPLENDFRARIGLSPNAGGGALTPPDDLEGDGWAQHEFGAARLGDARLRRRLIDVAAAKARVPDRAFSGVAQGDWAAVKAYYRRQSTSRTGRVGRDPAQHLGQTKS